MITSLLVEAHVTVQSNDPTDYSPDRLRRYLRRYHEISALCDGAHAIRYDGDRIPRTDTPDPMKNVHLKRDLDSALGWLQTMDQQAALLVFQHYIGWNNAPSAAAAIAERYDMSPRSVYRQISLSIEEMARFLGWRAIDSARNEDDILVS